MQLPAVKQPRRQKMNRTQRSHTILRVALEVILQSDVSIGYDTSSLCAVINLHMSPYRMRPTVDLH